jgi:hypothetical protein
MSSGNEQGVELKYLDIQAMTGITKHTGGFAATKELLAVRYIEEVRGEDIGCPSATACPRWDALPGQQPFLGVPLAAPG